MASADPSRPRTALILGATGLVGGKLLDRLLASDRYERVTTIGRRSTGRQHPALVQHVVDFEDLEGHADLFAVDDIFCCLGTTIRKAGSQERFLEIDVEYPVQAAELGAARGAEQFLVVSSLGADPDSRVFYSRAKGEMEVRVRQLPLRAIWILRPSLLLGERDELRVGERVAEVVMVPVAPLLIGPLRRYRPIRASAVAQAMVDLALSDGTGGTLESDEIARLVNG